MRKLRRNVLRVVCFAGLSAPLFLLAGPACGGSGNGAPPATAPANAGGGTAVATVASAAASQRKLPPGMSAIEMQALLDEGNEFIRTVLDDWYVTASEYEAAVLQALQCLAAEGVPYSEPRLVDTRDGPRWTYSVGPSSDHQVEEHSRVHDACDLDYLRPVSTVWSYQEQPSESERRQQDEELVACLNEAGITVSSREEAELLRSQGQLSGEDQLAFVECLTDAGG